MQTCIRIAMGHPGEAAKHHKRGNRHTGKNLTARQAQTIVGMIFKLNKIERDLDKRWSDYSIDAARQALVDIIVQGDRMDEIPPRAIQGR